MSTVFSLRDKEKSVLVLRSSLLHCISNDRAAAVAVAGCCFGFGFFGISTDCGSLNIAKFSRFNNAFYVLP